MWRAEGPLALGLVLFAVTVGVFARVGGNGFLSYDDPVYVTNNPYVKAGLTLKGIAWAFTTGYGGNWHPLTWISHMMDYQLFGLNPGAHHLMSVCFHAANALLLLLVLTRASGALWPSVLVAALFALHPLHVESVAWVAERKDVLSTFFGLLTMGAYVWYSERPALGRLVPAVVLFALSLMAKPMLVTLPFVLLLFDVWPLGRFRLGSAVVDHGPSAREASGQEWRDAGAIQSSGVRQTSRRRRSGAAAIHAPSARGVSGQGGGAGGGRGDGEDQGKSRESIASGEPENRPGRSRSPGRLWLEKIPFFALALLSIAVTVQVQRAAGAVIANVHLPFTWRFANALVVYVSYLGQVLWPSGLVVLYPHPGLRPAWEIAGAMLVLVGVSALVLRAGARRPYLAVGWCWYAGTLVPVIGLVQVGIQAMADRYTYVPLIGIFIMMAWGAADLALAWRIPRTVLASLAAVPILAFGVATWHQTGYWKSDLTIFRHAVAASDNNVMALFNLGKALERQGSQDEAIVRYREALAILPDDAEILTGLGSALAKRGSLDEAAAQYLAALRIEPRRVETCFGLANLYMEQGRLDEAIGQYEQAIRIEPRLAEAHNNLGGALARKGRTLDAIGHFEETLRINPEHAGAHVNLGVLLLGQGRAAEAASQFAEALRIRPGDSRARDGLARARTKEPNGGR